MLYITYIGYHFRIHNIDLDKAYDVCYFSDADTDKAGVADQNHQVPTDSPPPVTNKSDVSQCTTITTQADITPISTSADTPGKYVWKPCGNTLGKCMEVLWRHVR